MPVSWHFRGCKAPLSRTVSGAISSEEEEEEEKFICRKSELALPLPFYIGAVKVLDFRFTLKKCQNGASWSCWGPYNAPSTSSQLERG